MKAKLYYWIIPLFILLFSCATAKKNFEEGRYDATIEQAVKKLRKNPGNQKMIDLLYDAYRIANEKDKDIIKKLENENRPSNSEAIYLAYVRLENRQQLVKQVPELQPENITKDYDFQFMDYYEELADYKAKTVTFLKEAGMTELNKSDRFSARNAYTYFSQALNYDPTNSEIADLTNRALNNGYTWVSVSVGSGVEGMGVHPALESQLNSMNTTTFDRGWVRYLPIGSSDNSQYELRIVVGQVMMTPERVREKEYTDSKTVEDGFVYEYDAHGKKVIGADGKPVTKTVYKKVEAKVMKVEMSKECTIVGTVYLVDKANGNTLNQKEVFGKASFYHVYGMMNGDSRALSDESVKLLKISAPVVFPTQDQMVVQGSPAFATAVQSEIRNQGAWIN